MPVYSYFSAALDAIAPVMARALKAPSSVAEKLSTSAGVSQFS